MLLRRFPLLQDPSSSAAGILLASIRDSVRIANCGRCRRALQTNCPTQWTLGLSRFNIVLVTDKVCKLYYNQHVSRDSADARNAKAC
jgi:hypothetical protein